MLPTFSSSFFHKESNLREKELAFPTPLRARSRDYGAFIHQLTAKDREQQEDEEAHKKKRDVPLRHPPLPNVANPAARASLPNAPAVVANTPLDNGLLLQATAEHRAREAVIFSATVTSEEVLDANKRMLAVLSEHVMHDYPGALLPSNAILAAVYSVVAQAMNTVNFTLLAMDRRILAMDDRLLAMDRQFTIRFDDLDGRLDALDNASRQAHNARIEERTKNDPWAGRLQLRSYLRVNPAYGPGFPGGPAIAARRVDMGDEYPSPPFPPTSQAISTMEARDIMELSILMDNDFGIERGDPEDIRRNKVKTYLFYDMG